MLCAAKPEQRLLLLKQPLAKRLRRILSTATSQLDSWVGKEGKTKVLIYAQNCIVTYSLPGEPQVTEKVKELMKEIMKEITKKEVGAFSPEQKSWSQYSDNCIAAEICPDCGSDIFVNVGVIDKNLGRISTFSECSTCDWKTYNHAETWH
jgi:hypothetical protein